MSQAQHTDFFEIRRRILSPLALGTPLSIGRPFGPRRAQEAGEIADPEGGRAESELRASLASGHLESDEIAVLQQIQRLAAVDARSLEPFVEQSCVRLAALLHDVIAAFHPDFGNMLTRSNRRKLLGLAIEGLSALSPPATLRVALLRHGWLGRVLDATIVRIDVRWWTGHASFLGQPAPTRLTAWPNVRRVHVDEQRVGLMQLADVALTDRDDSNLVEGLLEAIALFFAASPLTDLAHFGRMSPTPTWTPALHGLTRNERGTSLARRALRENEANTAGALEMFQHIAPPARVAKVV